jgi:hypothetical protein
LPLVAVALVDRDRNGANDGAARQRWKNIDPGRFEIATESTEWAARQR